MAPAGLFRTALHKSLAASRRSYTSAQYLDANPEFAPRQLQTPFACLQPAPALPVPPRSQSTAPGPGKPPPYAPGSLRQRPAESASSPTPTPPAAARSGRTGPRTTLRHGPYTAGRRQTGSARRKLNVRCKEGPDRPPHRPK